MSTNERRKISNLRRRFLRQLEGMDLQEARALLEIETPEEQREVFLISDPNSALSEMMLGMLQQRQIVR